MGNEAAQPTVQYHGVCGGGVHETPWEATILISAFCVECDCSCSFADCQLIILTVTDLFLQTPVLENALRVHQPLNGDTILGTTFHSMRACIAAARLLFPSCISATFVRSRQQGAAFPSDQFCVPIVGRVALDETFLFAVPLQLTCFLSSLSIAVVGSQVKCRGASLFGERCAFAK